jgi:beta-N-acetylhexosaminidase
VSNLLTVSESLELLADRCLFPGFKGTVAPDWIRRRLARGLGGVLLYGRNVETLEQATALAASLHAERPEVLIAIDEEGGDVTRLDAATGSSYPGNLALGVAGDLELTRSVANAMGVELAGVGVDLDLAPDADVNSNPANPVIGVRAFGSDPALVAAQTVAWLEGMQASGVAACVKHFPGHGDTSVDSHLALPVVGEDPRSGALEPFRAAIAAGVRVVMSAHILVPSMDDVPATVSRRIMTDLLRGELGFDGLVMTDGLEMRGITAGFGIAGATVLALAAGCDALCIGGGLADEDIVDQLRGAIVAAVHDGRLSEERLSEAAARVDQLARWRSRQPHPQAGDGEVGVIAARRAVRADGPVRIGGDPVVVRLSPEPSIAGGFVPWGLAAPLSQLGARVTAFDSTQPPVNLDLVLQKAAGRSLVLVVRNLHRHPWQAAVAEALLARRPDTVVVEMGLPACRPKGARAYIATHGASSVCGLAAAEVLRA